MDRPESGLPEGVEITGPMHGRYEEVLTPQALGLVALLHRELGCVGGIVGAAWCPDGGAGGGGTLDSLPETRHIREDGSWRVADPAPGLVDRRVEMTGGQLQPARRGPRHDQLRRTRGGGRQALSGHRDLLDRFPIDFDCLLVNEGDG
jgi:hypothetical protein